MGNFLKNHPGLDSSFLEYPVPVLIQSGNNFSMNKFQVESSDSPLVSQAIYINVCAKFSDMCAMASRTLLVNPKDEQKQAYLIASDALDTLIKSLKVGEPISSAYIAAKNLLDSRNDKLQYHSNFGFGIGSQFKEDRLSINAKNQNLVAAGMAFHVRITLSNVHKDPARAVVGIGDTVFIGKDGNVTVTTAGVQKKYNEISYSLDDEEEAPAPKKSEKKEPAKKPEKKEKEKPKKRKDESDEYSDEDEDYDGESGSEGSQEIMKQSTPYTSSRLRSKAVNQKEKQDEMEDRKKHQLELLKAKKEELKIRFNKGDIKGVSAKTKVKCMDTFQAFKSQKEFPKDIVPGQIYVDKQHCAVLIPNTPTTFIPFHVSTIKSVSDTVQGQWTHLRINFHIANGNTIQFPEMRDENNVMVKELTLKTASTNSNNRLSVAAKQIKECMTQLKSLEQAKEMQAIHGEE